MILKEIDPANEKMKSLKTYFQKENLLT